MIWHQPVVTHLSTASDLLRARRLIEEPALSCLLFKATEPARRVPLTRAALEHLLAVTTDDDVREWATERLQAFRGRPLAQDRGADSTPSSYLRWKAQVRGWQARSSWERIGRGKRG